MRALIEEMPKQRPQPTRNSRSTALAGRATTSWKRVQAACTTCRGLILFATNKRLHEQSSTRHLTQKNFRSECIALFAGCESPRWAILLASTPARRNAAGCSPPLLSFTTCIRVLNQVRSRMFVLCSRVSTAPVRVIGYMIASSGRPKHIATKASAQVQPP